jgi:hypothetical protein
MNEREMVDAIVEDYFQVVPAAMAASMVALGNAMAQGNIAAAVAVIATLDQNLSATVELAAKVTATVVSFQNEEVNSFDVPDDLSGLEDL